MRKFKVLLVVLGIMMAFGSLAYAAPVTDTIQYPSGYFTPSSTTASPYYRWWDEDWSWTHNSIIGGTSATLNIAAWDVDAAQGEVDNIYVFNGSSWDLLGSLAGLNNDWGYTTFDVTAYLGTNGAIENGLQVFMDIDTTHTHDYWAVLLSKSVLSIDGGTLPEPEPNPTPEPTTLFLLGFGLAGLATLRKKF